MSEKKESGSFDDTAYAVGVDPEKRVVVLDLAAREGDELRPLVRMTIPPRGARMLCLRLLEMVVLLDDMTEEIGGGVH